MGRAVAILLGICMLCAGTASSQSHDAGHPTPLAPGANKGNVDNFSGANYYYFYAGPGRIDVRMAFHEMGIFGNPFRQTLTFDLSDDHGKVFYHQGLISQGNTATLTNYGTVNTRQKVLLTVTAQQAGVRLGGYYEFEVSGAVSFDGKEGSSSSVKPVDTSLTPGAKNGPVNLTPGGPVNLTPGGPVNLTPGGPVTLTYPGQALTVRESPNELRILLAADVLFDFGKAQIRPDAVATLRQAAAKIRNAKAHSPVLVEGYTDSKGSNALNLQLSQQRAEAVETWLIQNAGFSVSAFTPKGYGAARPVAPNQKSDGLDNPAGRQLNRRVELVVAK